MASKKYVSLSKLSNFLDNLKGTFALLSHKHTMSDITDYKAITVDSTLSSTSTNPVQNKVIDAEFDAISTAMGALETAIDGKSDSGHTHDDRYYTQTQLDTRLASKSDSTHNHDSKYDAKGSASAVQTNLNTVSDTLDAHIDNADIHVTATNKTNWNAAYTHSTSAHARTDATKVEDSTTNGNIKINGTETNVYSHPNSGVSAGTYKSVTVNAQGHVTGGSNPTTLSGFGITDAETKADASAKLTEAKSYADTAATTAANKVKNDLLNGAGTAYDTLKELGDLIDDNVDAIEALESVAAGKADKTHSHAIADVSGLQSALDGKAAASHGTHVSYSTTAPVMDGTASAGSASTVARSDHKHPTDTSRASKTEFDTHTSNTTVHITSTERTNWNAAKTHADSAHAPSDAEKNQNAFSNVKIGSTTIAADTATDTLTLVAGTNVTITPDATNDKITISATDTNTTYSAGTGISLSGTTFSNSGVRSVSSGSSNGTISVNTNGASADVAVKGLGSAAYTASTAYDAAGSANTALTNAKTYTDTVAEGKANTSHTHTIANVTNLQSSLDAKQATITGGATTITSSNLTANRALISNGSGKVAVSAVTSTELGYLDGVTSAIQTQLDSKAASSALSSYYTKTEIDNMEFITVSDIDTICGSTT